jgi:uncharacterized protein YraI
MNEFWSLIPRSTKIILAILIGMAVFLIALITIRFDGGSMNSPSVGGVFNLLSQAGNAEELVIPTPAPGVPTVVGREDVSIFSGPGNTYPIVGLLHGEQIAQATGVSPDGQWWAIFVPSADNERGWVKAESVVTANTEELPVVNVDENLSPVISANPSAANLIVNATTEVHNGPGGGFDVVAILESGQSAGIMGVNEEGSWYAVQVPYLESGMGWVAASQVEVPDDADIPTIVESDQGSSSQTAEGDLPTLTSIANVNVRAGPDLKYKKLGLLQNGQTAEIVGVDPSGYWWAIKFPTEDGDRGWVSVDYVIARNSDEVPVIQSAAQSQTAVIPTPPVGAPSMTVTGNVNIRNGPGTVYAIIGRLEPGQFAEVVGKSEDNLWLAIKVLSQKNGMGWITAVYAQVENAENIPVVK